MEFQSNNFLIQDGELSMDAFYVSPKDTASRPAVLVAHAWGGRSTFEDSICLRLAELGYVGVAIDLYGKGVRGDDPETNEKLMTPFLKDREMLQKRMLCSLDAVREMEGVDGGRVAAIGYCFGGLAVLDLARTGADIAGVVSFHGIFAPPGNIKNTAIKSKVLALHGWDDPLAPSSDVIALGSELSAAGADWQLHAYGDTGHAFTLPTANDPENGIAYSPEADRRSWQAMKNFLEELFS